MSKPYLPIAVKNISITLEDIIEAFNAGPDYKLLYFDRISDLFRQMAVGEFLMTSDIDVFFKHLQMGVQAYIEFLENVDDSEKVTSRVKVFFDATCINDKAAMARLSQLSTRTMNTKKEYEEDFYCLRILMDIFGENKNFDDIKDLFEEFEDLAGGNSDPRFELLKSLLEKDEPAFQDAMELLIEQESEAYKDTDLYSGKLDESAVLSHMSTEVIAWLKLATIQGFTVYDSYLLAPSMAISSMTIPPKPAGSWRKFTSYRSLNYKR